MPGVDDMSAAISRLKQVFTRSNPFSSKSYYFPADLIRVFAILGVVAIHVLTSITNRPDFFGGTFWWLCFLAMGVVRSSVPLFIMLSGYLVLLSPTTLRDNGQKMLHRIGVPLLVFYLINHAYSAWMAERNPLRPYDPASLFHDLHKNSDSYLYFLVILLMLYAVRPILKLVFDAKDEALTRYTMGFFFGLGVVGTMAWYTSLRGGSAFNTYGFWVLWVGYFMYGAWVRQNVEKVRRWWKQSLLAVVGGFVISVALAYVGLALHWQGNDVMFVGGVSYGEEYLGVGVMLMSLGLFNLGMTLTANQVQKIPTQFQSVIRWFAPLSFGVYLIHPLVIDVIHIFGGVYADNPSLNLPLYVFLNATLTLTISTALAWIIRSTPGLRRIIGG